MPIRANEKIIGNAQLSLVTLVICVCNVLRCKIAMGLLHARKFKNKHLMDMFERLCKETNQQKFNKQWQKLDELTGKKRNEDAAKTRTAQNEAEALCPLPTDTARTRRRSGSAVKTFSEWIENKPKEKWVALRYQWCKIRHNDHQLCRGLQLGDARCS
jgi:hypothetical protein